MRYNILNYHREIAGRDMADEGAKTSTNLNDESVRAEGGGSAVKITLVGFDKPLLTAIALVLSIVAAAGCWYTAAREERRVYFTQRCEAYIEQAVFNKQPVPYAVCGPREK